MIGFKVDQAKSFFFDRLVVKAERDATEKNLSKAGAFVRRTAIGLIRDGKKPSKPGKPPKNRTGILKRFIFFVWDRFNRSVVIGPAKTNQVFLNGQGKPTTGTVPEVLEYGGSVTQIEWFLPSQEKWVRADLRSKRKVAQRKLRRRTVHIAARPYMGPALAKNESKFPGLWANSVVTSKAS